MEKITNMGTNVELIFSTAYSRDGGMKKKRPGGGAHRKRCRKGGLGKKDAGHSKKDGGAQKE